MAKRFCGECRHFVPLYVTNLGLVLEERCKSHRIDTYRKPEEKCADPRQKNQNNDCGDFEAKPPKPERVGFWARLFGASARAVVPPPLLPRPGYSPPPVRNVVKPPAPPQAPAPGTLYVFDPHENVPRPGPLPEIKPPPEPTGYPNCARCAELERTIKFILDDAQQRVAGIVAPVGLAYRRELSPEEAKAAGLCPQCRKPPSICFCAMEPPTPFPTPEPSEGELSERPL